MHLAQVCERRDQLLLQALDSMPSHQRTALTEGLAALQQALFDQPVLRLVPEDSPPAPTPRDSARTQHSGTRITQICPPRNPHGKVEEGALTDTP